MEYKEIIQFEKQALEIPIIRATSQGDFQKVKHCIESGSDIDVQAPGGGKTPLHIAIERDYEKISLFLIASKANVNIATKSGFTALHVAAQKNNVPLITALIKAGSHIDTYIHVGCTPLHEAAAKGHKEAVSTLLKFGANPNIRDTQYNLTASNLANENRHEAVRDMLIATMTYQQNFIANVNYILFNWKRVFLPHTSAWNYIDKLSTSIWDMTEADEVFLKIKEIMKDTTSLYYLEIRESVSQMRKLLIENMHHYNANKVSALKISQVSVSSTENPQEKQTVTKKFT